MTDSTSAKRASQPPQTFEGVWLIEWRMKSDGWSELGPGKWEVDHNSGIWFTQEAAEVEKERHQTELPIYEMRVSEYAGVASQQAEIEWKNAERLPESILRELDHYRQALDLLARYEAVVEAARRTKAARTIAFAAPYMKQPNELGITPIHESERLLREAERAEDAALTKLEEKA